MYRLKNEHAYCYNRKYSTPQSYIDKDYKRCFRLSSAICKKSPNSKYKYCRLIEFNSAKKRSHQTLVEQKKELFGIYSA
jgi:hypothetical protein